LKTIIASRKQRRKWRDEFAGNGEVGSYNHEIKKIKINN
jgi:hypothetical protein